MCINITSTILKKNSGFMFVFTGENKRKSGTFSSLTFPFYAKINYILLQLEQWTSSRNIIK